MIKYTLSMKPSVEKLHKFFKLESEREYDNKAVMGGLSSMLSGWEAEARSEQLSEELIQAVSARLRDYHRLTPESRKEVLKGLWNRVRQEEGGDEPTEKKSVETAPRPRKKTTTKGESAKQPKSKRQTTRKRTPRPRPDGPAAALDAHVTVLDGVGPKNAEKLARLGIETLRDMLYHFPRRYDDYTQLKTINRLNFGEEVTVIGTVQSVKIRPTRKVKTKIAEVIINDGSGALRINWFNQPWLKDTFKPGVPIAVSGKIDQYLGRLLMTNPEWEVLDEEQLHTNRIVPVYPLTAEMSQRWLRTMMNKVVSYWALRVEETLPQHVIDSAHLMALHEALLLVHFPDSWDDLRQAQRRLAFDEVFYLQLGVVRQKQQWAARSGRKYEVENDWFNQQTGRFPYELTSAQQKALRHIRKDLASGSPMNRLLQGDVGSGKTAVAAMTIAMVVKHGAQAALIAPTSILAEQHHKNMTEYIAGSEGVLSPDQVRLLIGATPEKEKKEIRRGLESGDIKLVVGTHALLEDPIVFDDLQLAVIDEQHRFGVEQRALLRNKGKNPHLLVMTATPIPRSLALTVFGDLDLTVMDEMPPGRLPVDTFVLYPRERERAYTLINKQLEEGRQAFIIYPLVEESDKSTGKAVVEEHQHLQSEVFMRYKLGLLHGRLKADKKEAVMQKFRDQKLDILVSTTVIEVGVDVPNATVMLIEGANRFGLAQLHQLRGRVGRGGDKAYCLLIPENEDAIENERLAAMSETNDGFVLAERDLEQRGPGQFLGTRQAGFSQFKLTAMTDIRLIERARREARKLLAEDPELSREDHKLLAQTLDLLWTDGKGDIS